MKSWVKKNYIIIIVIIFVGLCCIPFIWSDWFFGTPTTIASKLTYIGAFIGGTLLAVNAYFIYKRTKELNRSNNLVAKGQLDTRFKDAATLLAQGNTSAELSGIHALHQIAIEASQTKDQQDYVRVIKEILIAFIKENSVIEYKKNENGEILLDECQNPIIEKAYNTKSNIVLQTIVDKLFRDDESEIYAQYPTDLSETVLMGINFYDAQLQNVIFTDAQLQNADFSETQLKGTIFLRTQLQYAIFHRAESQYACFTNAQLENADFSKAQLKKVRFEWGAQLRDVDFSESYDIDKAYFENNPWNMKTNFKDTAFENKTIEELTEIMGNPPTPLDK